MKSIVFFDIDATLALGTEIPKSAQDAIGRFRDNGGLVFVCTGRPLPYVEAFFASVADGFVCNNGRLAVCKERRLVDRPLTHEQAASFISILDELDAAYAFFGERHAWLGGNPSYQAVAQGVYPPGTFQQEIDAVSMHAYNFDVYFADSDHRERIATALGSSCLVNPHGPHPSADVTVVGFGKGDAVRSIAAAFDVSLADTYAFGDGINDISMLRAAGVGVAMGNAAAELKVVADHVTSDILDDGVARGLEYLGLV